MDSQEKVVSIFAYRAKQEAAKAQEASSKDSGLKTVLEEGNANNFDLLKKKNESNADRLRRERLKANKSVLKSYRIKH